MTKDKYQNLKIGLYVRVSSEEQAENPEGSIKNQEQRLREAIAYRNRNGCFGEIVGVFTDAGISAKDMNRPQLQELLRAIRKGEVNLVMVTELSRLSRNNRDFLGMWDLMHDHGCRFMSLREDFDTTSAAGEMLMFQLINFAQFERKQTSERVEANIAARAARGLYNGGMVPVGFKTIESKPGFLEIDDEMAATVKAVFEAFLREGSLAQAALWLNDNGYSLKRKMEGGGRFSRVGHFTVDNLQAMLRNKAYIGVKVYRQKGVAKETKAVWPAIVDTEVFHRAGKILDRNRRRLKPWKEGRMPYILSGLVHCRSCGSHMPGKSAHGNAGKVGYYEHAWATKRDATLSKKLFKCEPHRVPSKRLEPLVWEKLSSFLAEPGFMREILERVRKHHEANPLRKDQERLKSKITGIMSQLDALAERLAEIPKGVSAAPIFKQMERLEELKREHEENLGKLELGGKTSLDRIVGLSTFEDFAFHYKRLIAKDATVPQRKQMVQKFIRKVEVGTETVRIHFIVDDEHYKRELVAKEKEGLRPLRGVGSASDFFTDHGSNTLTYGAPGRT